MSDMLAIGASGARAYRAALATVSENIVNAGDPNYVRRRIDMAEAATAGHTNPLYVRQTSLHGVAVDGVTRLADPLADQGLRLALGSDGAARARETWLGNVEAALADGPGGVGQSVSAVFADAARLAAAPGDTALRSAMLASINTASEAMNGAGRRMADVATGLATAAGTHVANANRALAELADINRALLGSTPGDAAAAQLADRRDAALFDLAEIMPIRTEFGPQGDVRVTAGGATLVDRTVASPLTLTIAADATLSLSVGGAALSVDGGAAGALVGVAAGLATRRAALDTLAGGFSAALNGWNAVGQTPAGTAGGALLTGTSATTIRLIADSGSAIAAAANGSANGNLLTLPALRTADGAEAGWQSLVQGVAVQSAGARAEAAAARAQTDHAAARRDAVSGVDLDREAADLMRLQQAYDAAARVIQVARDTMQSILNIF